MAVLQTWIFAGGSVQLVNHPPCTICRWQCSCGYPKQMDRHGEDTVVLFTHVPHNMVVYAYEDYMLHSHDAEREVTPVILHPPLHLA